VSLSCPPSHGYCSQCEVVWEKDNQGNLFVTCQFENNDGVACMARSRRPYCDVIKPEWYDPAMKRYSLKWKRVRNGVDVQWWDTEKEVFYEPLQPVAANGKKRKEDLQHCSLCGQEFSTQNYLKRHVMEEQCGTKKFICILCGHCFPASRNLKRHQNCEERCQNLKFENSRKCRICSEKFYDASTAKRHIKICGARASNANRVGGSRFVFVLKSQLGFYYILLVGDPSYDGGV